MNFNSQCHFYRSYDHLNMGPLFLGHPVLYYDQDTVAYALLLTLACHLVMGKVVWQTSYKYSQDDIIDWELSSLVYLLSFIIFHISFKVKKPRKDSPPPTFCDEDCNVFFPELLLKRRFPIENEKHFFSINEIAQKWPAMEVLICSCRQQGQAFVMFIKNEILAYSILL